MAKSLIIYKKLKTTKNENRKILFKFKQVKMSVAVNLNSCDNYYDPSTGRFLSEDPIDFGGGDFNLYRYVKNKLPNQTDPSGKLSQGGLYLVYAIAAVAAIVTARYFLVRAREQETQTIFEEITTSINNQCGLPKSTTTWVPREVPDYGAINRNKERLKKIESLNLQEAEILRAIDIFNNSQNRHDLA